VRGAHTLETVCVVPYYSQKHVTDVFASGAHRGTSTWVAYMRRLAMLFSLFFSLFNWKNMPSLPKLKVVLHFLLISIIALIFFIVFYLFWIFFFYFIPLHFVYFYNQPFLTNSSWLWWFRESIERKSCFLCKLKSVWL
jgi:hypothetical protein